MCEALGGWGVVAWEALHPGPGGWRRRLVDAGLAVGWEVWLHPGPGGWRRRLVDAGLAVGWEVWLWSGWGMAVPRSVARFLVGTGGRAGWVAAWPVLPGAGATWLGVRAE